MPMQNPPHPGEVVKWECLEPGPFQSLSPNPPKGCGHAEREGMRGEANGWCGFDPNGFGWARGLEATPRGS